MRLRWGILLLLSTIYATQAAAADRITSVIDKNDWIALPGSVHPKAEAHYDQGRVDPSMKLQHITLLTRPSASQQAEVERLLAAQQNPSSRNYRRWLTPEQYADRFGLSRSDLTRLSAWLQSQGFEIVQVARGRDWIAFSGTAALVENAFRTEIHNYRVEGASAN